VSFWCVDLKSRKLSGIGGRKTMCTIKPASRSKHVDVLPLIWMRLCDTEIKHYRRCLLILNGLRVLMEWAWLFCTSHRLQSIYLSICHPHSDDATLSLGLETMMHATFVITPLVKKIHTACAFFCSFVLPLLGCSFFRVLKILIWKSL
jgi:hypothetical protein